MLNAMRHEAHTFEQMIICWLAIAMAILFMIVPQTAQSGAYETGQRGYHAPRWSNAAQLQQGLIAGPDCVAMAPGASAEYIPGRNAYGQPVPPADSPMIFGNAFPVDLDLEVKLKTKKIGRKSIDVYPDGLGYDQASNQVTLNGQPLHQDCLTSSK